MQKSGKVLRRNDQKPRAVDDSLRHEMGQPTLRLARPCSEAYRKYLSENFQNGFCSTELACGTKHDRSSPIAVRARCGIPEMVRLLKTTRSRMIQMLSKSVFSVLEL